MHSAHEQPSATRAFFGGFGSGAFNGALMMGLFFGVTALAAFAAPALGWVGLANSVGWILTASVGQIVGGGLVTTLATGLFSGVMAAKHAVFDAPAAGHGRAHTDYVAVPMTGMASPALAPSVPSPDMAEDAAPTRSWVSQTGREQGAEARVQQILANGAMSDKDRAGALLAAREVADKAPLSQGM